MTNRTEQNRTEQNRLELELKEYFKQLVDLDESELDLTEISADVISIVRRYFEK